MLLTVHEKHSEQVGISSSKRYAGWVFPTKRGDV